MKCLNCNKEFESKRSTAKYCSDKCRKLAFQKDANLSVPAVSVPASIKPKVNIKSTSNPMAYLITIA